MYIALLYKKEELYDNEKVVNLNSPSTGNKDVEEPVD